MRKFQHSSADVGVLAEVRCTAPFTTFHVYENGEVSNCCLTWLPTHIGNINDHSLLELSRQPLASDIRRSAMDGSYAYCDTKLCPHLSCYLNEKKVFYPLALNEALPDWDLTREKGEIEIYFNYDRSCNLACPSCRSSLHFIKRDAIPERLGTIHRKTAESVEELLSHGLKVNLNLTGTGDPFASILYWDYLKSLKPRAGLKVALQTNGTLMSESRLRYDYAQMLRYVNVSVDAFSEDAYSKIRKNGHLPTLRRNLDRFDALVQEGYFPKLDGWQVNLIVQADNFREIVPFTQWALSYRTLTHVWFNLISDWGCMSGEQFEMKAVWRSSHPDHEEFLEILGHPVLNDPRVHAGNMSHLKPKMRAPASLKAGGAIEAGDPLQT